MARKSTARIEKGDRPVTRQSRRQANMQTALETFNHDPEGILKKRARSQKASPAVPTKSRQEDDRITSDGGDAAAPCQHDLSVANASNTSHASSTPQAIDTVNGRPSGDVDTTPIDVVPSVVGPIMPQPELAQGQASLEPAEDAVSSASQKIETTITEPNAVEFTGTDPLDVSPSVAYPAAPDSKQSADTTMMETRQPSLLIPSVSDASSVAALIDSLKEQHEPFKKPVAPVQDPQLGQGLSQLAPTPNENTTFVETITASNPPAETPVPFPWASLGNPARPQPIFELHGPRWSASTKSRDSSIQISPKTVQGFQGTAMSSATPIQPPHEDRPSVGEIPKLLPELRHASNDSNDTEELYDTSDVQSVREIVPVGEPESGFSDWDSDYDDENTEEDNTPQFEEGQDYATISISEIEAMVDNPAVDAPTKVETSVEAVH